jgi:adenylate kinase
VIFLAGVHGVGKGYLGIPVAKALGISHLTASQLIGEEKGRATWGIDKKVADLDDNQLALVRAVAQKRIADGDILLDGHFVLRNSEGILVPLEQSVFADLKLSGVILLTEDTNIIVSRLALRDGAPTNLDEISELADAESVHAHAVCQALGLPLIVLHAPTESAVLDAVTRLQKVWSKLCTVSIAPK